jgi:monoamine oxidase
LAALVDALVQEIPFDRLHYEAKVVAMKLAEAGVELTVKRGNAVEEEVTAEQVIVALPPRLLAATIPLDPAPDERVLQLWNTMPTWMAPHAKFFALYDRPFWREAGFSGTAQSLVGPMAEIHDATTRSGQAALFGFVGVGAGQRAAMGEEALKAACLQQLARIFGDKAAHPRATLLKDWAADPLTATPADAAPTAHAGGHAREWISGPWQARLAFAGSETSAIEAGFLSGAVEASDEAAKVVRQRLEGVLAG